MNDHDVKILKLFHKCIKKLKANTRIFGNCTIGIGNRFELVDIKKIAESDIKEFAMNFRFFILRKEPIFFDEICKLLERNKLNEQCLSEMKKLQNQWNKNMEQIPSLQLSFNNKEISPRENLNNWFYGEFFHLDGEKVDKLEEIKKMPLAGIHSFFMLKDFFKMSLGILDELDKIIVKNILKDIEEDGSD